jgi:hypothetical protein
MAAGDGHFTMRRRYLAYARAAELVQITLRSDLDPLGKLYSKCGSTCFGPRGVRLTQRQVSSAYETQVAVSVCEEPSQMAPSEKSVSNDT